MMSDPTTVFAETNTTPNSCVRVNCTCDTMWSMAQQFSTVRLCTMTGENKGKLVRDYSVRARRIAATYARFYLEIEDGGNPEFKGRYYWMALGAFASKTVACTFDTWQVKGMTPFDDTVWEGLGKGNLWLFCDISGWHWYRSMFPKSFDMCLSARNAEKFVVQVKAQLREMPWKVESLTKIKNFAVSEQIIAGFKKVDEYEAASESKRSAIQLAHLLLIASHEQGIILQPLIYEDKSFASRIKLQRAWYANWASPTIEIVFTHACTTENANLKSVAPADIRLENFDSRMRWITDAAKDFHFLMRKTKAAMEKELQIIAGWKDLNDSNTAMGNIKEKSRQLSRMAQ